MARFGLVGGSYPSRSAAEDAESTMNWILEVTESPGARSQMALYETPGLASFAANQISAIQARDIVSVDGRLFALFDMGSAAGALYEVSSSGTLTLRGNTAMAGNPQGYNSRIIVGNFYLFIVCAGNAYAFNLSTNAFTNVTASLAQSSPYLGFFVDGYFGVVFQNSDEFQISALEDPTTWNGTDVAQVSVFPDNISGCIVDHREIWFWSATHAQVYYNSGNASFPLAVIPGAFIEQGIASPTCAVRMDNSVFWIGQDERGQGIAWRANGYVPQRVSNHAVEYQWSKYSSGVSDAISWTYQDGGHTFWVIYFPSGNATWVYDASTGQWHQRGHWNGAFNDAHLANCHAYCFGKHIVGSRSDGTLYEMSASSTDDNGTLIHRSRTAPVVTTEMEWIFHRQLVVDAELNAAAAGSGPALNLSWSDDGGNTWVSAGSVNLGSQASTVQRAVFRRLGRSRQRIYKLDVADETPVRIMDAYLIADPGFKPVPRLSKYFGGMQ